MKDYGYKCIGWLTTISKHDIQNGKLIPFDCLRWPKLEEIVWAEKNLWDFVVCRKDFSIL